MMGLEGGLFLAALWLSQYHSQLRVTAFPRTTFYAPTSNATFSSSSKAIIYQSSLLGTEKRESSYHSAQKRLLKIFRILVQNLERRARGDKELCRGTAIFTAVLKTVTGSSNLSLTAVVLEWHLLHKGSCEAQWQYTALCSCSLG